MDPRFEWDRRKANSNLNKHSVSFDEAQTVFMDPLFAAMPDPDHSVEEHRFIAIGVSGADRLLVISYTERESTIRIISARTATRQERRLYEYEGK